MRILIVTPAATVARTGNQVTAQRWSNVLRRLGCHVSIRTAMPPKGQFDLLVALHAKKSAKAVQRFHAQWPQKQIILAMTGTDFFDVGASSAAGRSLDLAARIIVLQPGAVSELPADCRRRARVIVQSAPPIKRRLPRLRDHFEVCVMGHLRSVKDPFRTAQAARRLPDDSRIRVTHLGGALSPAMLKRAEREMARNPRYRWLGNRPRSQALQLLARSQVLSLTSKSEGAPSVVSEAIMAGVPVISSRIPAMVGLLGKTYPGFFPLGDTVALAGLLRKCEQAPNTLRQLRAACAELQPQFQPAKEQEAWAKLLAEFPLARMIQEDRRERP